MTRVALVALVALVAGSLVSPLLAEAPQATGKFTGKNWEFETAGAYAYPGEVGFDDEPGILVAVSNATFNAPTLDRYWDREHVIDVRFKSAEALVVTFQIAMNGDYEGMSYYFGSGDGCGFCFDGKVVSTVKIADGRLRGQLALAPQPGENSWEIELDVPVAPADYGAPLPEGGGDVGAAYAAYHEALGEGDAPALAKLVPEALSPKLLAEPEAFFSAWRQDHPDKSYRVVKGFTRGDRALLIVEGENAYFEVDVEAHFVKEGGAWKIDDELSQSKLSE
jgi:hypothetical protein